MSVSTSFPTTTTVGTGLFVSPSTSGYMQGHAEPDPSVYFRLRSGILATTETLPMWGGIPIYQNIPGATGGPSKSFGPVVGRATTVTGGSAPISGFSVFDQAYGMVQSPASPVQLAGSGMQVMYYPLGSLARIAVACDPALAGLAGGLISQSVAWDFTNEKLVPYTGTLTISSGTYNSTTGVITLTNSTTPSPFPSVGDSVTLSSLTGTGGYATLNGTWPVMAGSSGTTLVLQGPTGAGASTITGGSATTGAALPSTVSVLDINVGNSLNVSWSSPNASWNNSGSCALIQI